jgi:hypothetical protein
MGILRKLIPYVLQATRENPIPFVICKAARIGSKSFLVRRQMNASLKVSLNAASHAARVANIAVSLLVEKGRPQ